MKLREPTSTTLAELARCGTVGGRLLGAALGLVWLLGAAVLVRADTAANAGGWIVESWLTDAGLPHNAVTALLQTKEGYLWIGTSNGLARFDGIRFTSYRAFDGAELRSNRILHLHEDRAGGVWIGTERGGLSGYRSGQFFGTTVEDLAGDTVFCISGDANTNLWVGTPSGLNRFSARQWTAFFQNDGLPEDAVTAICQPRNAPVIFATSGGLCRFVGNRIVGWQTANWPRMAGEVSCLHEDAAGQLWLAGEQGVWRFPSSALRAGALPAQIHRGRVLSLSEGRRGEIWFGTAEGDLVRVATNAPAGGGRVVWHFPSPVTALREDAEGNFWVGTAADGLHRLKPRQLRCLPFAENQEGPAAPCLFESPGGQLEWITPAGTRLQYRDGEFVPRERLALPAGVVVRTACVTTNGDLWIGTAGDGLFRQRGDAVVQFTERAGLSGNTVEVVWPDALGGVWIGTRNGGLNSITRGVIHRVNTPWGFTGNYASCLAEATNGDLWIGTTGDGLFQFRAGRFVTDGWATNLPSGNVRSLCAAVDGVIWVGTSRGLCRLKDGAISAYAGKTGLPNDPVWQLRRDRQGNLWIGYGGAILRVREEQLNAYAEGRIATLDAVAYGREDGLPNLQCLPAADSLRGHGGVWFATSRGLVVPVEPELAWNPLPPPVSLEQVLIENEAVPVTRTIAVPPGKESVQFRYAALSFTAPGKVAFRYRLEGYDREWSENTPNRTARYPRLPAGRYTFQVLARNNDGVWNEQGAMIAVHVQPFWWETSWFLGGLIAAGIAAAGGLYRLRQSRRRELERLRVRIASDLHDDLGSSLWSITLLSRLVAQSPRLGAEERQDVNEINRIAIQTSNSIRDIIWLINPAFDSLQDLLLRTKDFAAIALRGVEYNLRTEGIDLAHKLPLEFRQNLFLLFKEALTNIAKHAQATAVEIEVKEHAPGWQFTIRDNGVGFDPTAPVSGNGLRNLRTRAEKIHATFAIQSRSGHGTLIHITTTKP